MAFNLTGVALITGAASGIGRGVAVTIAQEGCSKILLADLNLQGLEGTQQEILESCPQTEVAICNVDISDEDSVDRMVSTCVEVFGRLDYALNLAGVVPTRTPIAQVEVETYDFVVGINEYGTWLCHRAQIKQMLKQEPLPGHSNVRGSVVSVSSLAGLNASKGMSTYSASKAALVGFAKADAQDYGPQGVRVNVVCPGMIETELFRKTTPPDAVPQLAGITPMQRLGEPKDIGRLLAFLSSDRASFIQGAVIPCDGGLSLQRGVI